MSSIALAAVAAALALSAAGLLVRAARHLVVVAQPDEWLLRIRNGRLVNAGVGVFLVRWPGDVVVRFTSTLQRVSFAVNAMTRERLRVSVGGFILWSVAGSEEGPFRAFQKLGLANLDAPPPDLRSPRHLLSTPQHHAFQQLLAAAVQRLVARRALDELLLGQDAVVADLRRQLAPLEGEMGVRVDEVQLLEVRPADEELTRQLAAEVEQRVREEAATVRLEAQERERRRALESEARLAREQAEALHAEALAREARALELAQAVREREALELAGRLDRTRREAEARRDAIAAVAEAEEGKSQALRDHELATLVAEKVGDALRSLPLHEARWITVGPDSPAGSLAGLVAAARELAGGSKAA